MNSPQNDALSSILTVEKVRALACPTGKRHLELADGLVPGFFVDALPTGQKRFRLRLIAQGVRRVTTIGDAAVMPLDEARYLAQQLKRAVKRGEALPASVNVGSPSLQEFFLGAYLQFIKSYKRSWEDDVSLIRNHVLSSLGHLSMGALQSADVTKLVRDMSARNYAAGTINRVLVLLSYGFSLALKWKVPGVVSNPLRDVVRLKVDNRIERYLRGDDTQRLLREVRASPNPELGPIISLLVLTGARKREALSMRWSDVDLGQRVWRVSRTKSGRNRHVPLSDAAMQVLTEQKRRQALTGGSPFVFPNPRTGQPFVSIFYSWDAARRRAGLPEFRIHDLRHSFASFLVNAGRSLYEVQELLGHADARTTSRYAHLSPERLRDAVQRVGSIVYNDASAASGPVRQSPAQPGTA